MMHESPDWKQQVCIPQSVLQLRLNWLRHKSYNSVCCLCFR